MKVSFIIKAFLQAIGIVSLSGIIAFIILYSHDQAKKRYPLYVIVGTDTMFISNAGSIDFTKFHSGIFGHNDTLTGIESVTFKDYVRKDTLYLSQPISQPIVIDNIALTDTLFASQPLYFDTTFRHKVLYGYAGIQFDSAHFYFKKYIFYKNKKDSVNTKRYKLLLEKYKSK